MAKDKTDAEAEITALRKKYEEQKSLADAANFALAALQDNYKSLEATIESAKATAAATVSPDEQLLRETATKLLLQCQRILPSVSPSLREVLAFRPKLRQWVGDDKFDEFEVALGLRNKPKPPPPPQE